MKIYGKTIQGKYFDSVTLMNIAKALRTSAKIEDAAVVMGTKENREILQAAAMMIPEFQNCSGNDLLVAVKANDAGQAAKALTAVDDLLTNASQQNNTSADYQPGSLSGALSQLPDANLVLISVPGLYAAREARQALEKGLHVMLFSDNVSIADELSLKQTAREKGLLMMGPDCGTAIINGVPLGFANAVRPGNIGVVAAAGTGLQAVTCTISNAGAGISQAIGTGGRDVKAEIGGLMCQSALIALAADPATEVILLVSKPPHLSVQEKLNDLIPSISKPIVTLFLGASSGEDQPKTLEAAALQAVALSRGDSAAEYQSCQEETLKQLRDIAPKLAGNIAPGRKFIRGLFSGGTICSEAQVVLQENLSPIYLNVPFGSSQRLENIQQSQGDMLLDMGEDEFTVGKPHPMLDFSERNARIQREAADPETAIILLDIVLGHGANPDPASELKDVVSAVSGDVLVIASVTGTELDPQNYHGTIATLEKAGAIVAPSSAAAAQLAGLVRQQRK